MEIGKRYREQLKTPSMRSVEEDANKNQFLQDAVDDIVKHKTTAGMIADETLKVEAIVDTLAGSFQAIEHQQNKEEDDEETDDGVKRLQDAGYNVEVNTTTFADTLGNKDLSFSDRGTEILVDGEVWSAPKVRAYNEYMNVYDDSTNSFHMLDSHYGPPISRGAGKFDYSEFSDEEMSRKIATAEHRGLGFANLQNITDEEWDQLFNDGYIEREVKSEDGTVYNKQYGYSKRSAAKNVISDKDSLNYIFDGTWDHGILMVNSAWVNTTSGISLDPSHADYKNDSATLEFLGDKVTKDPLHQGIAKIGHEYYGKDKWNDATNQDRQLWLQNNTKMNRDMARYLAKEGGIKGISDRGGWNQWSTMPIVAREENLRRSRGTLTETEGAFFGSERGIDMGDFYGKNSIWRAVMGSWKKGE